ncbi:hypothetical protein MMC10_002046 [Thelotrema lepadinum]|nr:hypothetical protein [Thelotrema lepadinum]
MPDKPVTVITYAASASLAAIALVYFFNPNYLIDSGPASNSASARKKGVVGLQNPLNDCFINSVLQALAGLGDLRLYLIRELHRRKLSDPQIYRTLPEEDANDGKSVNSKTKKILSLQSGEVTQALKHILDQLNERPIYKKTISAGKFIVALERAFETRLSKDQQDAQELLQVVAERVCDEYHAGRLARKRARKDLSRKNSTIQATIDGLGLSVSQPEAHSSPPIIRTEAVEPDEDEDDEHITTEEEEAGFPLEGKTQSQIECQHCHFVPKSTPVSFVMLTLSVPQKSSTTLNDCFDAHFKREIIDDYKCDRCRLVHAISVFEQDLRKESSPNAQREIQNKIERLKVAIEEDPEQPPKDIKLPPSQDARNRKIERHVKLTQFPQILVIHLSRSIFDVRSSSAKNLAKVSFPERLPLGSLLDRRNYKLLGMISHKGTHNSGHYECFRRQHIYAPFSTPHVDPESGPYSQLHTPNQSSISSPKIPPAPTPPDSASIRSPTSTSTSISRVQSPDAATIPSISSTASSSSPSLLSDHQSPPSTRPSSASINGPSPLGAKRDSTTTLPTSPPPATDTQNPSRRPSSATTATTSNLKPRASLVDMSRIPGIGKGKGKKKKSERWWRISDDKIKECKTPEVLGMEREVYLLFYEMERPVAVGQGVGEGEGEGKG